MSKRKRSKADAKRHAATPKATVARLSLYLRQLEAFVQEGLQTVSSSRLGRALGITDAQVRKDLACFGQFGYPGIGYRIAELIATVKRILGTDRTWSVALVGVGNLGRALLGYRGFQKQGFTIDALFDIAPEKVSTRVDGLIVHHLDDLPRVVRERKIRLAIVAVPTTAAQAVADELVRAGVEGILNFAPVVLNVPPRVGLVAVDLAIQLEQLSFQVRGEW